MGKEEKIERRGKGENREKGKEGKIERRGKRGKKEGGKEGKEREREIKVTFETIDPNND